MTHKLGVYYAHHHDWESSWRYMTALRPPVICLLMPGDAPTALVSRVHATAPEARIHLRWWDIDDGGEDNKRIKLRDPELHAAQDARLCLSRVEQMEREAQVNGLAFPPREQLLMGALNEPPTWEHDKRPAIVAYNRVFVTALIPHRLPALVGCFAVGHPEEWPPVWDWFQPVIDAMKSSPRSVLSLHEYWQLEGPHYIWTDAQGNERHDWGALAGRYQHCPFDVPILIGECGADGRLYDRHSQHTGWQGNMTAGQYAGQLGEYLGEINRDKRIIAALPFLTDYQNEEWGTFDTTPAHDVILAMVSALPEPKPDPSIFVPTVTTPPAPMPPVDSGALFIRCVEWVLEKEGGFQANPNDQGNYYQNKLIGTKYGISAASYGGRYDIPNLTREQAIQIYHDDYWIPSGANHLAWPACLLAFDTAVLHGVGTAQLWQVQNGVNPFALFAKRLRIYLASQHWQEFGAGWTARVAALAEEVAKDIT